MYSHYKPLRNFMGKQHAVTGLLSVWQHVNRFEAAVRKQGRTNVFGESRFTQLYELELIARELVLHAKLDAVQFPSVMPRWDCEMWTATGHVRRITEGISRDNLRDLDDALTAVLPLLHQQTPWQEDTFSRITRYIAIMRHPPLKAIAEASLGISLADLLKIGLAVGGALATKPIVLKADYAKTPGTADGAAKRFFELTCTTLEGLREQVRALQVYDKTWAYTFNPMRRFPLFGVPGDSRFAFAPMPQFLLWRVTDGLYYDLLDVSGFKGAFGDAIEAYVGEAIRVSLSPGAFEVHPEREYHVGRDKKLGADWRVSDASGHVFIECKAKRLKLSAKATGEVEHLVEDFRALAKAVVQNYKNIGDAQAGHVAGFENRERQTFNVVVTLEDWLLQLPHLQDLLKEHILQGLKTAGLPLTLIDEVPYTVLSMLDFERRVQDTARTRDTLQNPGRTLIG